MISLQNQIERNQRYTVLLLFTFPLVILTVIWMFAYIFSGDKSTVWGSVISAAPWVYGLVIIWFVIAYFYNVDMVRSVTSAHPLKREDNPRLYNMVENLSLAAGISMPSIDIVNTSLLNAYACGIDDRSYTIGVTSGLINKLSDQELEAVLAHEITHIVNRDTRLSIICTVFVGIFATLVTFLITLISAIAEDVSSRKNSKGGGGIVVAFVCLIVLAIGLLLASLAHFSISRKREFLADAGSAELTSDPMALASALRKISNAPAFNGLASRPISQVFIYKRRKQHLKLIQWWHNLFATHPPIEKRIELLENF